MAGADLEFQCGGGFELKEGQPGFQKPICKLLFLPGGALILGLAFISGGKTCVETLWVRKVRAPPCPVWFPILLTGLPAAIWSSSQYLGMSKVEAFSVVFQVGVVEWLRNECRSNRFPCWFC